MQGKLRKIHIICRKENTGYLSLSDSDKSHATILKSDGSSLYLTRYVRHKLLHLKILTSKYTSPCFNSNAFFFNMQGRGSVFAPKRKV